MARRLRIPIELAIAIAGASMIAALAASFSGCHANTRQDAGTDGRIRDTLPADAAPID